jgi:hypothetical protein
MKQMCMCREYVTTRAVLHARNVVSRRIPVVID